VNPKKNRSSGGTVRSRHPNFLAVEGKTFYLVESKPESRLLHRSAPLLSFDTRFLLEKSENIRKILYHLSRLANKLRTALKQAV
jgi:hypothetical protein